MIKWNSFALLLLVVRVAVGQTILSVLGIQSDLSMLNSFINSSPTISRLLSTASNFTFLAPSNAAINTWLAAPGTSSLSTSEIEALISYHLIHGTFPVFSFLQTSQFPNSNLNNATFQNVTGGQTVGLLATANGPAIISGNGTISTIARSDIVCTGGLIQVINAILQIPPSVIPLAQTQPDLQFFNQFLTQGDYYNAIEAPIIAPNFAATNVTYFVPNSQAANSNFTNVIKIVTQQELGNLFNYHVVPNSILHSTDLLSMNGTQVQTVQGTNIFITVQNGQVFINNAKILQTDFLVGNGVLHTIDTVLNHFFPGPPNATFGNFTGNFGNGFGNFKKPAAPLLPSTKAGIAVGVASFIALSFTGLYFLIRCLRRREQRKQGNSILEISKPQEYPKIPPKANRVLGEDLETGRAARAQAQSRKRDELEEMGIEWPLPERGGAGRTPRVPRREVRSTFL